MSRSTDSNCNAFNNGTLLENSMGFVGFVADSFDGTKDRDIDWGDSSAKAGGNLSKQNVTTTPQNARDTAKPCSCSCNSCIESGHSGSRCNCSTGKCCDGQRAMARTPKRFDGNNPTFPKGGSYFDGNNRMRSGRDVSNGGLKLR